MRRSLLSQPIPAVFPAPPVPVRMMRRGLPAFAAALGLLAGCYTPDPITVTEHTDIYFQEALREVDVLLVIDSSGSMIEEQQKVSENFVSFIEAFAGAEVDYHIGVITTDVYHADDSGLLHGPVITPATEDAEAVFAENVNVGIGGSGLEMGFEAALLALSEPHLSGANAGFYRQDASLSIVIFSDEEDISPEPVDDYLNFFSRLKGESSYRDHSRMNISSVVGDVPYGCVAEDGTGEAEAGFRYLDATTRTEGVYASICASDFTPIVKALGLDISGLKDQFPLTRCPQVAFLEVSVGGEPQTLGVEYDFVPERKAIRFHPDQVPAPGDEIVIQYRFHADATATCPAE